MSHISYYFLSFLLQNSNLAGLRIYFDSIDEFQICIYHIIFIFEITKTLFFFSKTATKISFFYAEAPAVPKDSSLSKAVKSPGPTGTWRKPWKVDQSRWTEFGPHGTRVHETRRLGLHGFAEILANGSPTRCDGISNSTWRGLLPGPRGESARWRRHMPGLIYPCLCSDLPHPLPPLSMSIHVDVEVISSKQGSKWATFM